MSDPQTPPVRKSGNLGRTAAFCAVFCAAMLGMAFAAVPLYKIFCQATGYGGTTRRAAQAPDAAIARKVIVRFDANIGNDLGWSFRPLQREMTVRLGQVAEAKFVAENRSGRTGTALATFNVSPGEVGSYFDKISCFCFTTQTLATGETRTLSVVFFVDPALVADHDLDLVDTITLSYAFLPAPADEAAVKPVAAATPVTGSQL